MHVDALQGTREEKWLYLPMDELIVIKEEYDKRAVNYHMNAMKAIRYPFEQCYPNPGVVYNISLKASMEIAAIMVYKNINCCRNYFKRGVESENQAVQKKRQLILDLIQKNTKITYFDIINSREAKDALEEELETLIDQRILSWGTQKSQYHEKFDGWIIHEDV